MLLPAPRCRWWRARTTLVLTTALSLRLIAPPRYVCDVTFVSVWHMKNWGHVSVWHVKNFWHTCVRHNAEYSTHICVTYEEYMTHICVTCQEFMTHMCVTYEEFMTRMCVTCEEFITHICVTKKNTPHTFVWHQEFMTQILLLHWVWGWLLHRGDMTPSSVCHATDLIMGWLRLIGCFKLWVSFVKEPYKSDDILQKRPIIWRSMLIVATPYCTQADWLFPRGTITHSSVWHFRLSLWRDPLCNVTWKFHGTHVTAALTPRLIASLNWHDSILCVSWLIPLRDMTHSPAWHDSFPLWHWHGHALTCNTRWLTRC